MQKNWYVVYTKPHYEKKVTSSLTKRRIESFCPYNRKLIKRLGKNKFVLEPLFNSYVFVNITEKDITALNQLENVVSFVYWKFRPAIITDNEIALIRNFTSHHSDIKIERNSINSTDYSKNIEESTNYTIQGKILKIVNRPLKVNLPSLGFTLIADIEIGSISTQGVLHGSNHSLLQ
ncbi:MAG: transcription termination/antitermination NusG family protein [Ferruginibacter sp.]